MNGIDYLLKAVKINHILCLSLTSFSIMNGITDLAQRISKVSENLDIRDLVLNVAEDIQEQFLPVPDWPYVAIFNLVNIYSIK